MERHVFVRPGNALRLLASPAEASQVLVQGGKTMRKLVYLIMLAAALVPAASVSAETAVEKQMAQRIGTHLKQSGQLHNYRVGVKYHNGVATLGGSVANSEQRDLAIKLARQIKGVKQIDCKLQVADSSEQAASNSEPKAIQAKPAKPSQLGPASFEEPVGDAEEVGEAFEAAPTAEIQPAPVQQAPMIQQAPIQQAPVMQRQPMPQMHRSNMPVPAGRIPGMAPMRQASANGVYQAAGSCPCEGGGGPGMAMGGMDGGPAPMGFVPAGSGRGPSYDNAQMPGYAWPSYASYPNYAALTYPQQYSPTAWPYIGPFYPYPQVPLAWRKVSLEWDDGWWFLDFSSHNSSH